MGSSKNDIVKWRVLEDNTVVAYVRGDIDLCSAREVQEVLTDIASTTRPRIIVNLETLRSVDSAGLATFLAANRRAKKNNGRMVFVVRDAHALRLFEATGLDRVFEMFEREEDAIKSLSSDHAPRSPSVLPTSANLSLTTSFTSAVSDTQAVTSLASAAADTQRVTTFTSACSDQEAIYLNGSVDQDAVIAVKPDAATDHESSS